MKKSILTFAASVVALLCGCNSDIKVSPGQAYFASFTYTGNDTLFDPAVLGGGEVFNPILQGSYSDATICRKGEDYYMAVANYTFFPGIPILHSTDLLNWEQICFAFPTERQLFNTSLRAEQGLFPSTIRYNKHNDTFYITGTLVGGGGHFVIKAKDPAGPWSDPEWLYGFGGVHPSLFFDDDGKAYLLNQGNPVGEPMYLDYKVVWCQQFDLNTLKVFGERRPILEGGDILEKKPVWLESPQMFRKGDYYYLVASEGGSLGNGYSSCVYRSKDVWGPYEHYAQNPILTQRRLTPGRENAVTNTGRVDMIEAHDGNWYAVFQGVRPYTASNDINHGRETFLMPVTWDDGWPYLIRNGQPVPNIIKAPLGARYNTDTVPFARYIPHGNFKYVEHFRSDTLPMQWNILRTPSSMPIVPNGEEGLVLPLEINNIRSQRHAGFIGIRQMHDVFSAETEMHFEPQEATEFAGLAMYLNDERNYEFGVGLRDDGYWLIVQKAVKDEGGISKEEVKAIHMPDKFVGRVFLRVERMEDGFAFSYKFNAADGYTTLAANVPVDYLSLVRSAGFYGVVVGLYASQEEI